MSTCRSIGCRSCPDRAAGGLRVAVPSPSSRVGCAHAAAARRAVRRILDRRHGHAGAPAPARPARPVAAAVHTHPLLGQVQLHHGADASGQEFAVVRDHHHSGPQLHDESLETVQSVQIQIVGGLIQQQDVVAGQQQRGQTDPRGLAPGQRRHRRRQVHREAEVIEHGSGPLRQVGRAQREPPVKGGGIGVVGGRRRTAGQRVGGPVQCPLGLGDAGSTAEMIEHPLPRAALDPCGRYPTALSANECGISASGARMAAETVGSDRH